MPHPPSHSSLAPDSLAFSLQQSALTLARVTRGESLTEALANITLNRPAIQDICFTTLRQLGCARNLLNQLAPRAPTEPLASLLHASLALLVLERYADHTLVDQAVQAASAHTKMKAGKGMVNAVLRRFLRERTHLLAQNTLQLSAQWNFPDWWIRTLQQYYPTEWENVLHISNQQPPLTLRVNSRKMSVGQYLQQLARQEIAAQRLRLPFALEQHASKTDAISLVQPMAVQNIPGFAEGWVSVQDAGAQCAAHLLDVQNGQRILDACAAPGGKTAHILELAEVDLLALDQDAKRLTRITENLQRLALSAQVKQGDAGDPTGWWDGQPFDRILADVPCSASGIVRRHPDIRWLRRPNDLRSLPQQQLRILQALWSVLARGGKLLYATCSVFPAEGTEIIQTFLAKQRDARQQPLQSASISVRAGQLIPMASQELNHDGFFYALLEKE